MPIKVFEISDVVVKDSGKEVGARNERRMSAVIYNKTPGFEDIQGLLDHVMRMLCVPWNPARDASAPGYYLNPSKGTYIESFMGMCIWR